MIFGDINGQTPPHHPPHKGRTMQLSSDRRHHHKTKRHHHGPTRHRTRQRQSTTVLSVRIHRQQCTPTDGQPPITSHRWSTNFISRQYLPNSDPPNCGTISPHSSILIVCTNRFALFGHNTPPQPNHAFTSRQVSENQTIQYCREFLSLFNGTLRGKTIPVKVLIFVTTSTKPRNALTRPWTKSLSPVDHNDAVLRSIQWLIIG